MHFAQGVEGELSESFVGVAFADLPEIASGLVGVMCANNSSIEGLLEGGVDGPEEIVVPSEKSVRSGVDDMQLKESYDGVLEVDGDTERKMEDIVCDFRRGRRSESDADDTMPRTGDPDDFDVNICEERNLSYRPRGLPSEVGEV